MNAEIQIKLVQKRKKGYPQGHLDAFKILTFCLLLISHIGHCQIPTNPGGIPTDRIPSHEALNKIEQLSLDNKAKAFELVCKAYELEKAAAFEDVEGFYMEIDHWLYSKGNAVRHDGKAWQNKPFFENIFEFWDFKNNRFWEAYTSQSPGGFQFASETIYTNNTDYTVFPTRRSYRKRPLLPDPYHGVMAHAYHAWLDLIPARLLYIMKNQPYALTYLGKQEIEGQVVDVVEFTWPSSSKRPRIYFLESNGQVFAAGSNHATPFDGDLANMVFYYGRQEKDGFLVPEENIVHFNERRILHRRITDFGAPKEVGEDFFKVDESFKRLDRTWVPVRPSSSVKGFEDTFVFQPDNYYYIELDNFVVAFDAPRHPAITRNIIRLIGEETSKPIQYVVVSHAHEAHIAGLRPFMEEGATIITTEKASSVIREMASVPSSKFAGPVFGNPVETVKMKFVEHEKSMVLKDGKRRVEIFNIGKSPSAEGNLVAYVKEDNILIQGGLYAYEGEVSPTNLFFMDWLKQKGFGNTTVVGTGHSPIVAKELGESKLNAPVTLELFEAKIAEIKGQ